MTRKECIEKAFDIIAHKTEEETLIALSYFAKALQAQDDNSYTNSQIEFYVILLNLYHKQPNAEESMKHFVKNNINFIYTNIRGFRDTAHFNSSILNRSLKVYDCNIIGYYIDGYFSTLINQDLASMWIKSIKYDAFLAKYQLWKNQKSIEKQELLQIEQMFESFDNELLK
jgi:hypothetical protein